MRTWADYLRIAACMFVGGFLVDWLGLLAWFGITLFAAVAFCGFMETMLKPNPDKPASERRKRSRMRRVQ